MTAMITMLDENVYWFATSAISSIEETKDNE
jgi:hypothetical protein